jgi:hypothetical protein
MVNHVGGFVLIKDDQVLQKRNKRPSNAENMGESKEPLGRSGNNSEWVGIRAAT